MNQGSDNGVLPANTIHGGRVMWKVLSFLQMLLMYNYWLELLIYGGCASLILLQCLSK